jgi:hypothetical protein
MWLRTIVPRDLAGADLNHVKIDAPAATISVVALGGGG